MALDAEPLYLAGLSLRPDSNAGAGPSQPSALPPFSKRLVRQSVEVVSMTRLLTHTLFDLFLPTLIIPLRSELDRFRKSLGSTSRLQLLSRHAAQSPGVTIDHLL